MVCPDLPAKNGSVDPEKDFNMIGRSMTNQTRISGKSQAAKGAMNLSCNGSDRRRSYFVAKQKFCKIKVLDGVDVNGLSFTITQEAVSLRCDAERIRYR